MGLQAHWLRILAFRIIALLGDIAGYDLLCDPALDLWNIALSLFSSPDKQTRPICPAAQTHYLFLLKMGGALKVAVTRGSRDLKMASDLQLQAVCHCSLFIRQSADPDQALGKEKWWRRGTLDCKRWQRSVEKNLFGTLEITQIIEIIPTLSQFGSRLLSPVLVLVCKRLKTGRKNLTYFLFIYFYMQMKCCWIFFPA